MKKNSVTCLFAIFVTGCAHNAPVDVSPSYEVYSNSDDKVEGHYALYVDASKMVKTVKPNGVKCSAHRYPVDARSLFEISVLKTFEDLVEFVEIVDKPLTSNGLVAGVFRAQLVVEVRDLGVDLDVIPGGVWMNKMGADVEISASIEAINFEGKLLGSTIEGDGHAEFDAGILCGGGAMAIDEALGTAMEETIETLGSALFVLMPKLDEKLHNVNP